MVANAHARWEGSIDDGSGTMATATGLQAAYTKASRFADGEGSNPEELIGAAHAGCFSQYLALLLSQKGVPPAYVETRARVSIVVGDGGPTINRIDLSTTVDAELGEAEINELATDAKANCPVSKALAAVETVNLEVRKA